MREAIRFRGYLNNDLELGDIVAAGHIGLLEACRRFDLTRSLALSTYASHWIRQAIRREIANCGHRVRIPVHMIEKVMKVARYRARADDSAAIGENDTGLSPSQVARCKWVLHAFLSRGPSLDSPNLDRDSDVGQFFGNERNLLCPHAWSAYDPAEPVLCEDLRARVRLALQHLPQRQRKVLRWRYGIGGCDPMTLEEIGQLLGLTRERVRQIEEKAISRLRIVARRYVEAGIDAP